MKIGIVTFYGVANYGAMLQAYALWKFLEGRGHSVEFINAIFCQTQRPSFIRSVVSRSFSGVKAKMAAYLQYHITDFSTMYPQTRRYVSYQDLKDNCTKYDALIVGSDQMWNPKWSLRDGVLPVVFLDFAMAGCKKISYAASFGVQEWGDLGSAQTVGRYLRGFHAISVRENSGVKVVEALSGRKAVCLPDPTLLWPDKFYRKIMSAGGACSGPYVFNYILKEWTDGVLERVCLRAVLRNTRLHTVLSDSCPPKGFFAPLLRALTVNDRVAVPHWLERIARADFVVTNSFHGTVFSILFRRPFVTLLIRGKMSGMNERVFTLLERLGLTERIVNDEQSINRAIQSSIDWDAVSGRIDAFRGAADEFFSTNEL